MSTKKPLIINTGRVSELNGSDTLTQASLPVMTGDAGNGGEKGAVPSPSAGDSVKYLRGDATWQSVISPSKTIAISMIFGG